MLSIVASTFAFSPPEEFLAPTIELVSAPIETEATYVPVVFLHGMGDSGKVCASRKQCLSHAPCSSHVVVTPRRC